MFLKLLFVVSFSDLSIIYDIKISYELDFK